MMAKMCEQFKTELLHELLEKINTAVQQENSIPKVYDRLIEVVKVEKQNASRKIEEFAMSLFETFVNEYFKHYKRVHVKELVTAFVVFLSLNGIELNKNIDQLTQEAWTFLPKIGYNLIQDKSGKIFAVRQDIPADDEPNDFKPIKIFVGGDANVSNVQRFYVTHNASDEAGRRFSALHSNLT